MTAQEMWDSRVPGFYKLCRPKAAGFIRHYGVAEVDTWGQRRVVELNPRGYRLTDVPGFADGEIVTALEWKPLSEGPAIVYRLNEVQKEYPSFDLLGHNCEHAAEFIWTGERESSQVKGWGVLAASLLVLLIVAR